MLAFLRVSQGCVCACILETVTGLCVCLHPGECYRAVRACVLEGSCSIILKLVHAVDRVCVNSTQQ